MMLVSGANGQFAGAVIANLRTLLPAGTRFAVGTRTPESPAARALAAEGIDVRRLDFDDPPSLRAAFAGIDKALITPTWASNTVRLGQHRNAIEAAQAAGVRHLVYPSFIDATPQSMIEHNRLVHGPTELLLKGSGLTWTILRHGLYAETVFDDFERTLATGEFRRSACDRGIAFISRDDLGFSAACVLARPGHENRTYTETAPRPTSFAEVAALMSEIFRRPIVYRPLGDEEWVQHMHAAFGVPVEMARSSLGTMHALAAGVFDIATPDYAAIAGRPARSMREVIEARQRQLAGR